MAGMHRGATAEARAAVRQDRIGDAAAGEHRTWTDRAAADVSLTPIFVKTGPLPRPKVGGVRPGFGAGCDRSDAPVDRLYRAAENRRTAAPAEASVDDRRLDQRRRIDLHDAAAACRSPREAG
jgi:hypothetical protein